MAGPVLSVCINTRNRADLLCETLDSIVSQASPDVEIVVVDGASTDHTPAAMAAYARAHPAVKYHRSANAIGIDEGYDLAVEKADGEFCWLMTDDDLLEPGAISRVLAEIARGYDLILVNLNCFTKDMRTSLEQKLYRTNDDVSFGPSERDKFFARCGEGLSYIGSVVLRRSLWFGIDRRPYYGTYFAHMAVILANTGDARVLLMAHPYIRYRSGNSSWTPRSFEIWNFKWPRLIWEASGITDAMKASVIPREPWRRALTLVKSRAMGEFDLEVLRRFLSDKVSGGQYLLFWLIAVAPRGPLNFALLLYCLLFRSGTPYTIYNLAITNPYPRAAHWLARTFGHTYTGPAAGALLRLASLTK